MILNGEALSPIVKDKGINHCEESIATQILVNFIELRVRYGRYGVRYQESKGVEDKPRVSESVVILFEYESNQVTYGNQD